MNNESWDYYEVPYKTGKDEYRGQIVLAISEKDAEERLLDILKKKFRCKDIIINSESIIKL